MKTAMRFVIYICSVIVGAFCVTYPSCSGMELPAVIIGCIVGFGVIFFGIEVSERLKGKMEPVVYAEWIDTGRSNSTGKIYKCSHCGDLHNPSGFAVNCHRQREFPDRCECCGAHMRKGDHHVD